MSCIVFSSAHELSACACSQHRQKKNVGLLRVRCPPTAPALPVARTETSARPAEGLLKRTLHDGCPV